MRTLALLTLWSTLGLGQYFSVSQMNDRFICNLTGEPLEYKRLEKLSKKSEILDSDDPLNQYLNRLVKIWKLPKSSFRINNINSPGEAICTAHVYREDPKNTLSAISINVDYYASLVDNETDREAMFIWILAHELTHHRFGDLRIHMDEATFFNYKKELLADQNAGYALGKLTSIDLSFFDRILPKLLVDDQHSATHPAFEYRIYAAKAGWLEAVLENRKKYRKNNRKYLKNLPKSNEELTLFESSKTLLQTVGLQESKAGTIYYGEFDATKLIPDGKGVFLRLNDKNESLLYMGDFKQDSITGLGDSFDAIGWHYQGNFLNGRYHGQGTLIGTYNYSYSGEWKEGKKHGYGIERRGMTETTGCWENDIYIGKQCN